MIKRITKAEMIERLGGRKPKPRSARFAASDVKRAVKAAQKANLPIASVRIEPDGSIVIVQGAPQPFSTPNPWD